MTAPILPASVLVLGFGGAIALFFIRVHPCSSVFICGKKRAIASKFIPANHHQPTYPII
ncbi:hypothetical protein [Tychonema sp. LEGE 06208]|uniref:hypothetical protein n=1 Tax=Tychonema sp. LEGE 06208 TaxID=1828663 RepID=UPI0018824688|nr:hypothetical protein [Tychonema sp. LEGE 06208]MBE9165823.1 hypothetical protein [Tychonema sp. LEGE 06208]